MNMSEKDKLNWSADLRRISWWLQSGNVSLAEKFIQRGKKLYPKGKKLGGKDWNWWQKEISTSETLKAAERALTWSVLLK